MGSVQAISHSHHQKSNPPQPVSWGYWLVPALLPILLLPALMTLMQAGAHDDFMYAYASGIELLCAAVAFRAGRHHTGISRIQWSLIGLFFLFSSATYALALSGNIGWWPSGVGHHWIQGTTTTLSYFCCFMALTLFRTGEGLSLRMLDTIMAALVCLLYLVASYAEAGVLGDGPSMYIRFSARLILALAAGGVLVSTRTRFERQFTSILFRFMVACAVLNFLINIVNHRWLHDSGNVVAYLIWGIPEAWFCYMVARSTLRTSREITLPVRQPLLQTVTPPMLTLAAVSLALYTFSAHPLFNGILIVLLVSCYAARTHLHYQELFAERQRLRTRAGHMERLATHDSLTGIGNRRWLEEVANQHLSSPAFAGASLLLIDVDRFKQVNDTAGHAAGDLVLREVADELCRSVASVRGASVARMGGDEFAIYLPSVLEDRAFQIAQDTLQRIQSIGLKQLEVTVTVSIGISTSTAVTALTFMLELADEALYEAKDNGRNNAVKAREEASLFAAMGHHTTARRFRSLE